MPYVDKFLPPILALVVLYWIVKDLTGKRGGGSSSRTTHQETKKDDGSGGQ